jgi:ATP-dependent helicase Lhr and Lhr-like helicase
MTNSARSSFEPALSAAAPSAAYELYHRRVQRWIYDTGWERLRDAQERAAAPILNGDRDVIIAAATASGKTEAAWLPICSALVRQREASEAGPGVQALFISPLKALINDQYDRMTRLCDRLVGPQLALLLALRTASIDKISYPMCAAAMPVIWAWS